MQHVLAPPARAALFLVVTVRPGAEGVARDLLADMAGIVRAVGFGSPDDELSCVVGVGATAWERLYDLPRPAGLHPFIELHGDVHHAPSTPGDLLFHVRSRRMDLCFSLLQEVMIRLAGSADVVDETHGFRYYDQRDMLGFVDGTENPEGDEAAAAVYIGDEDPEHAGGSYVIVQKYLHDLDAWRKLSTEEQETVIGRRKLTDIEIPDADKASNSHVALNTVTDADGNELDILRDNMPFGSFTGGEFGTYFIGYAADPAITEQMLRNMFIGKPRGNHDRVLDFSRAVTGTLFYVPPADFLEDPVLPQEGAAAATPPEDAPTEAPAPVADGSLGIGSLHRL